MNKKMNIALVAHDSRKTELLDWVRFNYEELSKHNLYATGTTGRLITNVQIGIQKNDDDSSEVVIRPLKDNTTCLLSGPLGGDSQIGSLIAEGKIDMLIFFCDNLILQGHNSDISALTRLASLYNIAFATNRTTADMLLTSSLFASSDYKPVLPKAIEKYRNRKL